VERVCQALGPVLGVRYSHTPPVESRR
jgi:hypothetical protein